MTTRRWLGTVVLLAPLLGILIASVWFAAYGWMEAEGQPMPLAGYVAMGVGIFFTLLVGVGLMSLVFYSQSHGYDDAADRGRGDVDGGMG